jgi:hypothetical protein
MPRCRAGAARAVRCEVRSWHYGSRSILPTGRSETSELVPCCSFSNSLTTLPLHLLLRLLPTPHLVFISCGSSLTCHHVESTVSPPIQRNALFSPARRCSCRHPGSRCSQLLCRLQSKLFRPSEPGIKVCSAIGQCGSAAKPMLDDLEWLLHNAFGLLTRHEAMVRLSDAQAWPQH